MYLEHAQKPEIIEKTSGYYAVVGSSDAMKSAQLLRGQPTSITESSSLNLSVLLQSAVNAGVIDIAPDVAEGAIVSELVDPSQP